MRIFLTGQKWFGAEVFRALGNRVSAVAAPAGDRLAAVAVAAGVPVAAVEAGMIDDAAVVGTFDLLVAAHAHWRVSAELRARCAYSIGFHPSLLPLYRGRDAVEATIAAADRVTGGTVYHLEDRFDAGPIAFQDWCFVPAGSTPQTLWRDRLAPMGIELLTRAADHLAAYGFVPGDDQEMLATAAKPGRR